jgi:hypothetical protein
MAIRRNKKRIDPRYFLNETTYRDEIEEGGAMGHLSRPGREPTDRISHSNRSVDSYSREELQMALVDVAKYDHPKYAGMLPEWMPQWIEDVKRRAAEAGLQRVHARGG